MAGIEAAGMIGMSTVPLFVAAEQVSTVAVVNQKSVIQVRPGMFLSFVEEATTLVV